MMCFKPTRQCWDCVSSHGQIAKSLSSSPKPPDRRSPPASSSCRFHPALGQPNLTTLRLLVLWPNAFETSEVGQRRGRDGPADRNCRRRRGKSLRFDGSRRRRGDADWVTNCALARSGPAARGRADTRSHWCSERDIPGRLACEPLSRLRYVLVAPQIQPVDELSLAYERSVQQKFTGVWHLL